MLSYGFLHCSSRHWRAVVLVTCCLTSFKLDSLIFRSIGLAHIPEDSKRDFHQVLINMINDRYGFLLVFCHYLIIVSTAIGRHCVFSTLLMLSLSRRFSWPRYSWAHSLWILAGRWPGTSCWKPISMMRSWMVSHPNHSLRVCESWL
jgi:hypothetical protein